MLRSLIMARTPGKEPEIIGPEQDHEYNDPELNSLDFLRAIQRDRKVPLQTRIDAAKAAAVYEHPRLAQINQDMTVGATIRIEGGLPDLPGTNIIMPNTNTDKARKANGSSPPSDPPVGGVQGDS